MKKILFPGLKKEDFDVSVENGVLLIKGEHKESKEEKKDNYSRREFNNSKFERSFALPENAKADSVKARYANGVLKISLAKTPTKKKAAKSVKIS